MQLLEFIFHQKLSCRINIIMEHTIIFNKRHNLSEIAHQLPLKMLDNPHPEKLCSNNYHPEAEVLMQVREFVVPEPWTFDDLPSDFLWYVAQDQQ